MNSERRYTEDEVDRILDRATEPDLARGAGAGGSMGLTLRELHEIGREVGIPEEVITQAASSLDRPAPKPDARQTPRTDDRRGAHGGASTRAHGPGVESPGDRPPGDVRREG